MPNVIEIEETFCGRTDLCTYVQTDGHTDGHLRPSLLGRLCPDRCTTFTARRGQRKNVKLSQLPPTCGVWSSFLTNLANV